MFRLWLCLHLVRLGLCRCKRCIVFSGWVIRELCRLIICRSRSDLFRGLDILRDAMACAKDDPDAYDQSGAYLIRRWTSCAPGAGLEMALHPGGHAIPSGWSRLALDWFESHFAVE